MFDEATLARKYLDGKLAAVFASHDPFDVLQEDRTDGAVIVKLFGTIVNSDSRSRAKVLVICAFVGILKPSPAADVVDQDCLEVGSPRLHFQHKRLQSITAVHS